MPESGYNRSTKLTDMSTLTMLRYLRKQLKIHASRDHLEKKYYLI